MLSNHITQADKAAIASLARDVRFNSFLTYLAAKRETLALSAIDQASYKEFLSAQGKIKALREVESDIQSYMKTYI